MIIVALATMVGAAAPRNLPKAIEKQLELQHQNPSDSKVVNDLGNLLILAGRQEEAEAAYQRAIELAPEDPVPLYNLALLRQRQGRGKEALDTFKAVVKLDPNNAWAHYQVGALYEGFNDKSRAITAYGRAFALDPELASSDVNPQVIDSKWVVEAMLQGYRSVARQPLAPQAYDDPNRIAMLMISTPNGEEEASEQDQMAETPDDESSPPATPRQLRNVGSGEEDDAEAPEPVASSRGSRRVLTSENIETGSTLGEVGPSGSGSRSRASRQTTATRRPSSTIVAPRTGTSTRNGTVSSSPLNPPTRSTGRVRYRPSLRSTGSLDLDLLPSAPDHAVPAG
ncbi:MAG: tetratricopeptide repeat protein [Acidobacteria bacterium]|nr:tetratricopeptide repeat protein [Acidobacteriota bacterium]